MEFLSREIFARLRHPQKDFEEVEVSAEVRWDPLTGRASRISSHKHLNLPFENELPDISEAVEESAKMCVFCPPLFDRLTPKLPGTLFKEEKLEYKGTVLFPNLFPYGVASGVCIYGRDLHFVEIGRFSLELQTAGIVNCREYIRRYRYIDPTLVYSSITQNYLPSAGGSFVHPHLQVQVDPIPTQGIYDMVEGAKRYRHKTGSNYWEDLIAEEEKRGERWVGRTGGWAWYTPFAPGGFKEVAAAMPGKRCITECSEDEISDLARGIDNVQRLYRKAGINSFNFAIYSVAADEASWTLCFSMVQRANWRPWYRNDRTFHEVVLGEVAVPETPERVAGQARPYFAECS